jgi:hypothetical protein
VTAEIVSKAPARSLASVRESVEETIVMNASRAPALVVRVVELEIDRSVSKI